MNQPSVFVSGASKGIGLAIAKKYHREGYRVGICARGETSLEAARKEMPGLLTYVCDVSVKEEVKLLAAQINKDLGVLDVLVNNAGLYTPGNVYDEDEIVYEQMMRTNMDSAYYLTRGILPAMLEQQRGSIVNIASIASLDAYPGGGSYSISKFAMLGFSKNLRFELRDKGIRVVSVIPGAVLTDSWSGYDGPEELLMPPEDIAAIVFASTDLTQRTVVEDIVLRPQKGNL